MVSDGATYMNGECVTIDGGAWMASGGSFNGLANAPRAELKRSLEAFRGR
jgi:hypothetical protein